CSPGIHSVPCEGIFGSAASASSGLCCSDISALLFFQPFEHDSHQGPEKIECTDYPHDGTTKLLILQMRQSPLLAEQWQQIVVIVRMGVSGIKRCIGHRENHAEN